MNFNKTFLTLGLAATLLQMPTSSFAQNAGGKRQNPLLVKSSLPFGAPDFSKIQESDYLPAFEAAIKDQRANIQKIVATRRSLPSRTPSSLMRTAVCCWIVFPTYSSVLPVPTRLQALQKPRRR